LQGVDGLKLVRLGIGYFVLFRWGVDGRLFKVRNRRVWLMDYGIRLLGYLLGFVRSYILGQIIILGRMMKLSLGYPPNWTSLSQVMIYWVTVVTGGLRIYKEGNDIAYARGGYVPVPFGISVFPRDLYGVPRGTPPNFLF